MQLCKPQLADGRQTGFSSRTRKLELEPCCVVCCACCLACGMIPVCVYCPAFAFVCAAQCARTALRIVLCGVCGVLRMVLRLYETLTFMRKMGINLGHVGKHSRTALAAAGAVSSVLVANKRKRTRNRKVQEK